MSRSTLSEAGRALGAGLSTAARGMIGGGGAGGQGVTAVRTVGEAVYDPTLERDIEYGEIPDEGEAMTLNGPIGVAEFLETLALATEWNVLVTEEAKAVNLEFWITETKPKAALEEIFKFHELYYEFNPESRYLYVMSKEEHLTKKYGKLQEHEFIVEHASVDYIESVLSSLLSPKGRLITDPRTLHVFVWDTNDNIAKMTETVTELDVPLEKAQFTIQHADVPDMEAILSSMLSPNGELVVDPRTGQLLIKDLPSSIEQIRATVERLDVPLESRVFQLTYVDADLIIDSIEPLISERGLMQVDPHLNKIVVTDLPSRQDRIAHVLDTLDQKLETRTWKLDFVEPDDIAERVEILVPEDMGDIVVDEDVHQLTVTALPERLDEIDELIAVWDIKRRQVEIEAYLVTVSNDIARKLNVNWSYFDNVGDTRVAYRISEGAAPTYTSSTLTNALTVGQLPYADPLRNPFTGDPILNIDGQEVIKGFRGDHLAAVLDYLDTQGEATVLSAPRVVVQDGEEAIFDSGRRVPYVSSTSGYGGGSRYYGSNATDPDNTNYNYNRYNYGYSQPYNRIDFVEIGTILTVLPRITEEDSILLDISAEDSDAIDKTVVSYGEENTIPEKIISSAETQVRIHDSQTIVIGGLRKNSSSKSVSRPIPLLGDIPVLGRLFRNPDKSITEKNLMIFIKVTIVDEYTHPEARYLANVDDDLAQKLRTARKKPLGRLADTVTQGKNEIGVSVGESGHMHCEGERATLDDLQERFHAVKRPGITLVVIRKHPRAPEAVVTAVLEKAMEADLRVEFDDAITPFVPDYGPYTSEPDDAELSQAVPEEAPEDPEPEPEAEGEGEESEKPAGEPDAPAKEPDVEEPAPPDEASKKTDDSSLEPL